MSVTDDCEWVGFDLDFTLLKYRVPEIYGLIHSALSAHLSAAALQMKMPELSAALKDATLDVEWCCLGCVFDLRTGDVLKLDAQGKVIHARHGCTAAALGEEEIHAKYGDGGYRGFGSLLETFKCEEAYMFGTQFEIPAAKLCAILVDGGVEYSKIMPLMFDAFNDAFDWPQFAAGRGAYFPKIRACTDAYVHDGASYFAWLQSLRSKGNKRLFLLTNSNSDYATMLLDFAFPSGWRDVFDIIIYRANKKHAFFQRDSEAVLERLQGHEYVGGNVDAFLEAVGAQADAKVCYFGDDLNGDVKVLKARCPTWKAVAIVEEAVEATDHVMRAADEAAILCHHNPQTTQNENIRRKH